MKVQFPAGVKIISGTIRQKNGNRVMFKTYTNPYTGEKKTRAYLCTDQDYVRKNPPAEKEMQARDNFARRAKLVKHYMQVNPSLTKRQAWDMAKQAIKTES